MWGEENELGWARTRKKPLPGQTAFYIIRYNSRAANRRLELMPVQPSKRGTYVE